MHISSYDDDDEMMIMMMMIDRYDDGGYQRNKGRNKVFI